MKTKFAQNLLLAFTSTLALSSAALASHNDTTDIKLKGISAYSATAQAFKKDPAAAAKTVETFFAQKAADEADTRNTRVTFKTPINSSTAQAFAVYSEGALKTIEACLLEKAEEDADKSFTTVKFRVDSSSPIAKAYRRSPAAMISFTNKALESEQEDKNLRLLGLQITKQAMLMAALEEKALDGSYSAMRELASLQENPALALKWYFVELLASFGESYDFKEMVANASDLSAKAVDSALISAADFMQSRYAQTQEMPVDIAHVPENFCQTFDAYLAQGNVKSFFAHLEKLGLDMARIKYLNFFKLMGVASVPNRKAAMSNLEQAAKNNHAASKELLSLLNFLRNTGDVQAKSMLAYNAMTSKRPLMQYINRVMDRQRDVAAPVQQNLQNSIITLRTTLKIDE